MDAYRRILEDAAPHVLDVAEWWLGQHLRHEHITTAEAIPAAVSVVGSRVYRQISDESLSEDHVVVGSNFVRRINDVSLSEDHVSFVVR